MPWQVPHAMAGSDETVVSLFGKHKADPCRTWIDNVPATSLSCQLCQAPHLQLCQPLKSVAKSLQAAPAPHGPLKCAVSVSPHWQTPARRRFRHGFWPRNWWSVMIKLIKILSHKNTGTWMKQYFTWHYSSKFGFSVLHLLSESGQCFCEFRDRTSQVPPRDANMISSQTPESKLHVATVMPFNHLYLYLQEKWVLRDISWCFSAKNTDVIHFVEGCLVGSTRLH